MSKTTAPYRHKDGSNCWTKNCSRGNTLSANNQLLEEIKNHMKTQAQAQTDNQSTNIDVIASLEDFQKAVEAGRIYGTKHPEYPYTIYKYSQVTTYAKDWDDITIASRGLVVNHETGEIVARPFKKFFNYSEGLTPDEVLTGPFRVADKLDGSLGILFKNPSGGYEITTAGGFSSDQAAHASKIYNERYAGKWSPNRNLTYLYEIVYPQNRIVVNYGDEDDIYLLGAVNKRTGVSVPLEDIKEWKWKRAEEYDNFNSISDIVNAPDPGIAKEGYIVHFTDTDARVKFKFGEYLQVHKLATGLNSRRIHAEMRAGGDTLANFKMNAPEEFKDYIETEEKRFAGLYANKKAEIETVYNNLISSLPADADQKTFAMKAQQTVPKEHLSQMFTIRSRGQVNEDKIWESIEPPFEKGFWAAGNGSDE